MAKIKAFDKYLKEHKSFDDNCSAYKTNLDGAAKMLTQLQAELNEPGGDVPCGWKSPTTISATRWTVFTPTIIQSNPRLALARLRRQPTRRPKNANALPNQIDPPINSVAHSLNFVVAYGAGISPSWSLLQWKGPGGSGNTPFLSASGRGAHLNIALAPRSGGPAIGTDALRLINNQVIRSLGQSGGGYAAFPRT